MATTTKTPKTKILFVCAGNTCRSPMAEVIFKAICKKHKRTGVIVRSAGTAAAVGSDMMPEVIIALQNNGIAIPKKRHVAKQYLPKMEKQYDYIFDLRDYDDPYLRITVNDRNNTMELYCENSYGKRFSETVSCNNMKALCSAIGTCEMWS